MNQSSSSRWNQSNESRDAKNTRKAGGEGEVQDRFIYSRGISSSNTFHITHYNLLGCPRENIDYCSFYLSNRTEFIVVQTQRVCLHWLGSPHFTEISLSACGPLFQSRRHTASCVKDSGKVRSHGQRCENVSLVRQEGGRALWRAGDGRVQTLSNCRHLSLLLCRGSGSVCVCVCGWGSVVWGVGVSVRRNRSSFISAQIDVFALKRDSSAKINVSPIYCFELCESWCWGHFVIHVNIVGFDQPAEFHPIDATDLT